MKYILLVQPNRICDGSIDNEQIDTSGAENAFSLQD
jgi:hypothetical protein